MFKMFKMLYLSPCRSFFLCLELLWSSTVRSVNQRRLLLLQSNETEEENSCRELRKQKEISESLRHKYFVSNYPIKSIQRCVGTKCLWKVNHVDCDSAFFGLGSVSGFQERRENKSLSYCDCNLRCLLTGFLWVFCFPPMKQFIPTLWEAKVLPFPETKATTVCVKIKIRRDQRCFGGLSTGLGSCLSKQLCADCVLRAPHLANRC